METKLQALSCAICEDCYKSWDNKAVCAKKVREVPEGIYRGDLKPHWCPKGERE